MQVNLNLNNSSSNNFNSIFSITKANNSFTQSNQNGLFKNNNTSQTSSFPFGNNSGMNTQQTNLQSYGFGVQTPQNNILNNNTMFSNTNIMNSGTKIAQNSNTTENNIKWQEIKLTRAVKPVNTKIVDSLVKCVASQSNLCQYSCNQIRCKVYFQRMGLDHNRNQISSSPAPSSNIFCHNPMFAQSQYNPRFEIYPKNDAQNMNELNKNMLGYLNYFMSTETFFPLFNSFLESFGITSDILQFLIRMDLTQQQIKQFINRRLLLKNLQKQKALRNGLLRHYPILFQSGNQGESSSPQHEQFFNRFKPKQNQNVVFNRFVDYIIFKEKCSWQSQIIEDCMRKYLKTNIVHNQQKQRIIKQLLDQLQNIGLAKTIQEQRQQRKKRINMLYHGAPPSLSEQQKQVRQTRMGESLRQIKTIPLQPKKYHIETQK